MLQEEKIPQSVVWQHWQRIEKHTLPNFRSDIRGELPSNLEWVVGRVESDDIPRLFIISSDDWSDISGGTFQVLAVNARLEAPSVNANTVRIAADITKKIRFLESGGWLDTYLIAITDDPGLSGRFTILEGNRRSVAFLRRRELIGSRIFVGCSPEATKCVWTRHTYRGLIAK